MKLTENTFILFDRGDYKAADDSPDYAGQANVGGEVVAIEGKLKHGEFGPFISGRVVPWHEARDNPKYYGLTAKQAIDAELGEPEF